MFDFGCKVEGRFTVRRFVPGLIRQVVFFVWGFGFGLSSFGLAVEYRSSFVVQVLGSRSMVQDSGFRV